MARRSSGGAVEPEVRLAITLRMLAGGSYIHQMMTRDIGRSVTFLLFLDNIRAVIEEISMPCIPLQDEAGLRNLSDGLQMSRERENPLYGCVGALDAIDIGIKKPPNGYVSRNFYCREVIYTLAVYAVVDSNLRFLYMSFTCSGSIHDSVPFATSGLARRLGSEPIILGYWIAGDAVYVPMSGLITPSSKSHLSKEDGVFSNSFNFFNSSHQIHVEQAFEVLVQRWVIL